MYKSKKLKRLCVNIKGQSSKPPPPSHCPSFLKYEKTGLICKKKTHTEDIILSPTPSFNHLDTLGHLKEEGDLMRYHNIHKFYTKEGDTLRDIMLLIFFW